jgi:RHS repeat-associated protein
MSIRAALYARVSTNGNQNPQMQLEEMREYCKRRGWDIAGEYVDAGISGSKERRAGYECDQETGLDHMWFRYYNPRIGRFMSADPLDTCGTNPQGLNKFAYVENAPADYTDSLGLFIDAFGAQHCGNWTYGVTHAQCRGWGLGTLLDFVFRAGQGIARGGRGGGGHGRRGSPSIGSESELETGTFGFAQIPPFTGLEFEKKNCEDACKRFKVKGIK